MILVSPSFWRRISVNFGLISTILGSMESLISPLNDYHIRCTIWAPKCRDFSHLLLLKYGEKKCFSIKNERLVCISYLANSSPLEANPDLRTPVGCPALLLQRIQISRHCWEAVSRISARSVQPRPSPGILSTGTHRRVRCRRRHAPESGLVASHARIWSGGVERTVSRTQPRFSWHHPECQCSRRDPPLFDVVSRLVVAADGAKKTCDYV